MTDGYLVREAYQIIPSAMNSLVMSDLPALNQTSAEGLHWVLAETILAARSQRRKATLPVP